MLWYNEEGASFNNIKIEGGDRNVLIHVKDIRENVGVNIPTITGDILIRTHRVGSRQNVGSQQRTEVRL